MTKRLKDSMLTAFAIVTGIATLFTVLGLSLKDMLHHSNEFNLAEISFRIIILFLFYSLLVVIISVVKYYKYKDSIKLEIGKNTVEIKTGDIFKADAWRVIGVDTHFETTVDDVVISKSSLHGKFVLEHGEENKIKEAVEKEAKRREVLPDENGKYAFPLGTAIPCEGTDGTYIMVAFTELNKDFEAHTHLSLYESTLMAMWRELYRVYEKHDLALAIMGSGITRFDDYEDDPAELLRCMLCTLNTSKAHFKSQISIIVYRETKSGDIKKKGIMQKVKRLKQIVVGYGEGELPLYEYRDLYKFARK